MDGVTDVDIDSEIKKQFHETIEKINQEFMELDFKSIKAVHIDLDCFYDFDIATILAMLANETQYKYMMDNLEAYEQRKDDDTSKYFPDLELDSEMLREFQTDPENLDYLSLCAPTTNQYQSFPAFLEFCLYKNEIAAHPPKQFTINFNLPFFGFSEPARYNLENSIKRMAPKAKVEFVTVDFDSTPKSYYQGIDYFLFKDMEKFCNGAVTSKLFMEEGLFLGKVIQAPPRINPEIARTTEHKPKKLLNLTEKTLDVLCEFSYINLELVIEGSNNA